MDKKINDLVDSFELEELSEREEFVIADTLMANQSQELTFLRWIIDI